MLLPCGVSYTQTRCGLPWQRQQLPLLMLLPFGISYTQTRCGLLWQLTAAPFPDAAALRRLLHPDALWTSLATDSSSLC